MSQTCPSLWAKAQGAIVFPLDLGNKRIPRKLLNRLSLCWEKQRRNLKNVPLLSGGKNSELSPLTWQTGDLNGAESWRSKKGRNGGAIQPQDAEKLLADLHTDYNISINCDAANSWWLRYFLFCEFCSNFSKRNVRIQSSVNGFWIP